MADQIEEMDGSPDTRDVSKLVEAIRAGDRGALARGITLVESRGSQHRLFAERLLDECARHEGKSMRVGFSGVPGAGKSTLIEKLGLYLIGRGHRVAVLAVDPSSTRSGGSVLGDKTRMQLLAREAAAFIRPSPSRGSLGGVAARTREAISLCEAAGYDVVLVETVGVGQSETEVAQLVDFVFLLVVTGTGDNLQGIKRGVTEHADSLVVTKADGDNERAASVMVGNYKSILRLFRDRETGWEPSAIAVSALEGRGMEALWSVVEEYGRLMTAGGYLEARRKRQLRYWLRMSLLTEMQDWIVESGLIREGLSSIEGRVSEGEISPRSAAASILRSFLRSRDG